jgi:photosystem II stability/assembly factor-like uncharacterized protein
MIKMIKKLVKINLFILTIMLSACGGGGNGISSSDNSSSNQLLLVSVNSAGILNAKPNTSYMAQMSNGVINFILPSNAALGDQVSIIGKGESNWTVQPEAGQNIRLESFGGDVGSGSIAFAPANRLSKNISFNSIATSSDGSFLSASSNKGIFISKDYGQNWIQTDAPNKYYFSITMSHDGSKIVAIAYLASYSGIYVSNDFGATWSLSSAAARNYRSVAISGDGSFLAASAHTDGIYTSLDGGASWTLTTGPIYTESISLSSNGSSLIAGSSNGIYTSSDYGTTWRLSYGPNLLFYKVVSSDDGTRLVGQTDSMINAETNTYLSTDSGSTWSKLSTPVNSYTEIALSGNGRHLVLSAGKTGVYLSDDEGITWSQTGATKDLYWYKNSINRDGSRISIIEGTQSDIFNYYYYFNSSNRIFSQLLTNYGGVKGGPLDALTLVYLGEGTWGVLSKVGSDFTNY